MPGIMLPWLVSRIRHGLHPMAGNYTWREKLNNLSKSDQLRHAQAHYTIILSVFFLWFPELVFGLWSLGFPPPPPLSPPLHCCFASQYIKSISC